MNFREELKSGLKIGTFLKIPSTDVVEIIAFSGFDFIVIDLEHSPISLETAKVLTSVAQGMNMKVMIRPWDSSRSVLLRILDLGVDGIQVPLVENRETAESIVNSSLYPPFGKRGFTLSHRAAKFGFTEASEYIKRSNSDILIVVQIESDSGLTDLTSISDVDRIDVLFLGPADLSTSLGVSNDFINGGLKKPFQKILNETRIKGKLMGIHVNNNEKLLFSLKHKINYILWDTDLSMLKKHALSDINNIKSLAKTRRI